MKKCGTCGAVYRTLEEWRDLELCSDADSALDEEGNEWRNCSCKSTLVVLKPFLGSQKAFSLNISRKPKKK